MSVAEAGGTEGADAAAGLDDMRFRAGRPGSLLQFALKACIVAAIVSLSTVFVVNLVVDNIREQFGKTGGRQFWTKLENDLDRAADPESDLPPEQKQRLINDIHVIVARWRPFLDAVITELQKPSAPEPKPN